MNFESVIDAVLAAEKGYVDHPNDRGGQYFTDASYKGGSANLIMPAGNLNTSATNYSTLDLLCRDGVMWVEISRRA